MIEKRSLSLGGHRTSASLEPEFWEMLERFARADGRSLSSLAFEVDRARAAEDEPPNLSSALRLYVLRRMRAELETAR
ncbi:MAG: ribbon-helix-helix domain-containing protein [Pseudomonadota bacterium]